MAVILPNEKLIFIHIPKTGGTYVEHHLLKVPGAYMPELKGVDLRHLKLSHIEWMLSKSPKLLGNTIIHGRRNSEDWLRSMYRWLCKHWSKGSEPLVNGYHPKHVFLDVWKHIDANVTESDYQKFKTITEQFHGDVYRQIEEDMAPVCHELLRTEHLKEDLQALIGKYNLPIAANGKKIGKNPLEITDG